MYKTVVEVLESWRIGTSITSLCSPESLDIHLESFPFLEAKLWCKIEGVFGENCRISLPVGATPSQQTVSIRRLGGGAPSNVEVVILKPTSQLVLFIGGNNAKVFVGKFGYDFRATVNMWRQPTLCIGDDATSNGTTIIVDDADVVIGRDCMFSDLTVIQSHDQHGIIDVDTLAIINRGRNRTVIEEHVWIGRRAFVMPDVSIGKGSIISAGAIVTSQVPQFSIAAGVPARTVKSRVSWCRQPEVIDSSTLTFLASAKSG